jgi:hypothetical protein
LALAVLLWMPLGATTLEQLSVGDMIQKSTAIVRAKITGSFAAYRGPDIYTYYHLSVTESLKSSIPAGSDVAVPGGSIRGVHQTVAGAPALKLGEEYVLFLWTSRSGLTQVIGLTQGLFSIKNGASADPTLHREAAREPMVDASGKLVQDNPVSLPLSELRARVRGRGSK